MPGKRGRVSTCTFTSLYGGISWATVALVLFVRSSFLKVPRRAPCECHSKRGHRSSDRVCECRLLREALEPTFANASSPVPRVPTDLRGREAAAQHAEADEQLERREEGGASHLGSCYAGEAVPAGPWGPEEAHSITK